MTVKELIKQLRKMPQHLEVYVQDHDSSEHELSSKVAFAYAWDKEDVHSGVFSNSEDGNMFAGNPEKCVCLRC